MREVTFCLVCGAEVAVAARCSACGAPLGKEPEGRLPRLHRRWPPLYVVLSGLAVVAALVALAILLWS